MYAPKYPLHIAPHAHHFVDSSGKPFLYHADTGWTMVSRLTLKEAESYLETRRLQGWTTIQTMVLPFKTPGNREGAPPFDIANDLSTPNAAYFDHAEKVFECARAKGFLLAVSSAWFGFGGDCWYEHLNDGNVRDYGLFLGKRFGRFDNIVWIHGGDCGPREKAGALRTLAEAIREQAPHQLQTFHGDPGEGSSSHVFHGEQWLDFNCVYWYPHTWPHALEDYRLSPAKPSILGESGYELEANDQRPGTPLRVRRQAWWFMLCGGAGHAYGSGNVWNFGPGWREALYNPGAVHLSHLCTFLHCAHWHRLAPDSEMVLLKHSETSSERVVAAFSAEEGIGAVYTPTQRVLTINQSVLGADVEARWFDPTSGIFSPAEPGLCGKAAVRYHSPEKNAFGDNDFSLLLCALRSSGKEEHV
jgi:hypothetical protein